MEALRYPCLVLDHDDTVVNSTAPIHYPGFLSAMGIMRPGFTISLQRWLEVNFNPGFMAYCENELHFTPEDFDWEYRLWQEYIADKIPAVFPGMDRIIRRQKQLGGYVCVVSHSSSSSIVRDYTKNGLPEPDLVFGWDLPPDLRKPAPYALEQIMERLHLQPQELLMVDDLKPGYDMATACQVDFAPAGWAHSVPEIRRFMQDNCPQFFTTPEELERFLFHD